MFIVDLLKELAMELLRALFLEELCQRVKDKAVFYVAQKRSRRRDRFYRSLHIRHRERLMHRLITEGRQDL
jgi:hypothetical protein